MAPAASLLLAGRLEADERNDLVREQQLRLRATAAVQRVLDKLEAFDRFLPEAPANPVDLLERHGKTRQRARPDARPDEDVGQPWRWGDDA